LRADVARLTQPTWRRLTAYAVAILLVGIALGCGSEGSQPPDRVSAPSQAERDEPARSSERQAARQERRAVRRARARLRRERARLRRERAQARRERARIRREREEARREREREQQEAQAESQQASCHPSYDPCLDPNASDYDCAGGSGDGPAYTEFVTIKGPDDYGLDADGDGTGCE
jgi:hypothetical protein